MPYRRLTAALLAGAFAAAGLSACNGDRESRNQSNPGDIPAGGGNTVETNPTTLQATTKTEQQVTQPDSSVTTP